MYPISFSAALGNLLKQQYKIRPLNNVTKNIVFLAVQYNVQKHEYENDSCHLLKANLNTGLLFYHLDAINYCIYCSLRLSRASFSNLPTKSNPKGFLKNCNCHNRQIFFYFTYMDNNLSYILIQS